MSAGRESLCGDPSCTRDGRVELRYDGPDPRADDEQARYERDRDTAVWSQEVGP